jgi:putative CocE/NonD family hydrolase
MRGSRILIVACLLLAALPAGATAKRAKWTEYDRPATYDGIRDSNVPIRMSDGTVLRANVDRPDAPGRFPVLVIQTPYNKDAGIGAFLAGPSSYFVRRGYVVVTLDVRGTGSSGGDWDSFGEDEQRDGPQIVAWAADQPWSSGKVGLTGPSYMGIMQLLTAAQRPPHLKAIFPIVPMADSYRDVVFSGGSINVSFIPFWLGLVTAGNLTPSIAADDPLGTLTVLLQHLSGAASFTIPNVVEAGLGTDLVYDGDFWRKRSPLEVVDRIRVPAFVVGGLHDLFQRGEPLVYEHLKRHVPAHLLMGPWTHVGGSTGAGLPRDGVPGLNQIALRWFDHWLLGKRTHVGRMPAVTQYAYGPDRYVTQPDWPDPRLRPVRRYLRGDGAIAPAPPTQSERGQSFFQDPLAGICTLSTAQWTAGLGEGIPCTSGKGEYEQGVASFKTPPLDRPLELSGPILANLWLTTTAADAAITVRVKDVAPNGDVTELTDGWLSASFRAVDRSRSRYVPAPGGGKPRLLQPWHPFTRASVLPVRAGEPVELPVEVFPTRATILPGHRLKVTVSGGDFPHQLPPLPQAAGSLAGRITMLSEPGHASYLELPSLRKRCGGGCRPLPVPNLTRGR